MKSIASKVTTPGGSPSYKQPETGEAFVWTHGWHGFLVEVEGHRRGYNATKAPDQTSLDLDPGWQERLEHEFCEQNPRIPALVDGQAVGRYMTLEDVARFTQELRGWVGAGASSVSQEEAERRAEICVGCPYNIRVTGCLGCSQMAEFLNLIGGVQRTKHEDQLRHCGHCGCALTALIHWPLDLDSRPSESS